MQPSDLKDTQDKLNERVRAIRTIWFALFVSVGLYYLLSLFTGNSHQEFSPDGPLLLALVMAALLLMIISLLLKGRYLKQAIDEQKVELVQTGYILAWAMTEVAALLGLMYFFLTGNRHYYILFLIAAFGHLLNFPRRQHLLDASFKKPLS